MQAIKTLSVFILSCFAVFFGNALFAQTIVASGSTTFCAGGSVVLKVNDAPANATFQWTKDNVDIPGEKNDTYTALVTGNYTVVIKATGPDKTLPPIKVTVNSLPPTPTFTFTPSGQCSGTAVQFNITGPQAGITYTWDFGDGNTATSPNFSHIFNAIGNGNQNYNVKVNAKNALNCTSISAVRVIAVKQRPDASIADYVSLPPFTNCGSSDFSLVIDNISNTIGTNSLYQINWGDGSPTYSSNILPITGTTHTYTSQGFFTLILQVTGQNGCIAAKNYSVYNGSNPEVPFTNPGASIGKCVPFTFSVPSTTTSNPPGTKYIITKNDGTATETLANPPPPNYIHTFTAASCGATGGITPNTYFVNIRADNPCGFSDLTIQPITTNTKPIAKFSVSPDTNACINTTLTFTNNSTDGVTVSNGGVCSYTTQNNWAISPATGWTLSSGALGNVNPSNNPATWGSQSLGILFKATGEYFISIIVRNVCGNDTIKKRVCIRNPPTASFTMDKKEGCAPTNVNFTNTTPVGPCGGERYNWAVTYDDTEKCGNTNGFSFIGGTTATSKDPQMSFTTAGRYIIRLTVNTNATGCAAVVATDTFYAKAKPQVVLPSIGSVCAGNTIAPTATVKNCYSNQTLVYAWQFTGGSPATSNNAIPGNILYNNNGSFTVNLSVTNECGSTPVSTPVNITSKPTAIAGANKEVCSGGTTQLGVPGSGFTYSWKPSSFLSNPNIANPTISPISNTDTTLEYILTVSAGANCVSTDTVLVRVKRAPIVVVNPIETSICTGASATLTASGADTYIWSPSTGLNINNQTTVIASPGSNTNYTVTGTLANGCFATATALVRVVPFSPADAGPNQNYCSGQSAIIGTADRGMNYSWSPTAGLSNATIARPTVNFVYTGMAADTVLQYVLTAAAGANCSSTDSVLVTVKRSPIVVINPIETSICSGASATLTGSGADSYSWSPSTGLNVNNQATVIASPGSNANYTVTGTLANGCFATATALVRVVAFSPADAGLNQSYCSGLSAIIGTANRGMNYSWSPSTGLSNATIAMPTVNFVYTGAEPDTVLQYILTASAGANCTSTDTVIITVKRTPIVTISPIAIDICPGGAATLTAAGAENYTWSPANGLSATNLAVVIASPASTQQYLVTGSLANGCFATATTIVNVKAKPIVTVGPDTTTCNNAVAIQLTGSPAGGVWDGNNFISTAGVFNPMLAGNGVHKARYTYSLNGCNSADSLWITVINPPMSNAGADAAFCAAATTTQLNGLPIGGAWSGSSIVSPNGLLQLNTAGIYTLVYSVGSGSCIGTDTVLITIGDAVVNNLINSVAAVCTGNTPATIIGSVATAGSYPISYQWQQSLDSANWSNINGAADKDFAPPALTQTTFYRRIASSTLCAQGTPSLPVKVLVHPNAIASFSPTAQKGCAPWTLTPAIVNLTTHTDRNSVYQWYVNGVSIGAGEVFPGFTIQNPADSIMLKLVAISRFGCLNDSMEHYFVTAPQPTPSFTLSDTVGCGPLNISLTNTTPDITKYSFYWNFGNGQTSTNAQPASQLFAINPNYGDTVYRVTLNAITDCDTIRAVHFIRVRAQPKALFTPNMVQGCSPMTVSFFNNSRGSNASFVWDFGDGTPQVPSDGSSISHTFFTGKLDTFYVKLLGSNDCGIDTQQYAIVVNPNTIKLNIAVNGNQVNGCAPHRVLFVNNTVGANLFRYNFGDGSPELTTTKGIDSVWHTYTQTGTYKMSLFATNSCSDTTTTINIQVEVKPLVSFTALPAAVCVGEAVQINNTSENGLAWTWRFGDGSTSSLRSQAKNYAAPGNYRIWLIGTKTFAQGFGCADSAFADILVRDTLTGNFTVDSTGSCAPMRVAFKNLNKPSANTVWDFGDGNTAVGDSVVHVYTTAGLYTVSMVARSAGGCYFSHQKNITVNGPTGQLQYRALNTCLGDAATFEAISNNTGLYRFYFGDGDSLITTNPTINYTYKNPGGYLPSVVLQTANCALLIKGTDTLKVDRVKAGFRHAATIFCGSTQISFTDTSNAYFGIRQWDWNFGDGTFSSLKNPVKTFTNPGLYNVQLTVTGISGCTNVISIPVSVAIEAIPAVAITGDSVACTQNKLALTAVQQSGLTGVSHNWNFGNGTMATGTNVEALYVNSGVYTVRLISRTAFGCADTTTKIIRVNQSPVVFAGTDKRICLGQSTTLNATGAPAFLWSPAQGLSCTNCINPVANPVATTTYSVTGTNAIGCTNTDSVTVQVIQPFEVNVTPNDTLCIGQSSQLFATGAFSYVWQPAVGLNNANIPNPIATPASTTLYRVVGFDNYNCFTDTAYTTIAVGGYPTVNIGTGAQVVAGTAVPFNPVITNGPIKTYTWTPATLLSCNNCPNPIATINNNITYRLEVENIYGCSGSDTISYQVLCSKDDQVFIPNAFSPDGDGVNDVFMVHGKGIVIDYFKVFNRWGQLVFDGGSNYQPNLPQYGWNGKVNGKPATQDVYVYMVQLKCTAGGTFTYKGNVSLMLMR